MLRPMSHLSLGSKVAGSADAMALNSYIVVPLTHRSNIDLRHLQDQTELLAEQQLHDCTHRDAADFKYKWTNGSLFRIKPRGRKWAPRPPAPSDVSSTSIPRFPANAISSRQQIRPPSLMSCPALSRRSERVEKAMLLPPPFKKINNLQFYVSFHNYQNNLNAPILKTNQNNKKGAILQISMQMNHLEAGSVFTFQSQLTC